MVTTPETIAAALDELAGRDADIARTLADVGYPEPRVREPGFATLLNIIIGQQVSVQSAAAIRGRLLEAADPLTPESFLALDDDALRAVGFSRRKIEYGRFLAQDIQEGRFDPDALPALDDGTALEQIVARKGLGRWSAEVYLLFALGRGDIWPADDLAVQVAVQHLKRLEARPDRATMDLLAEAWRPHRGAAALLMWHVYKKAAL
ncbi:MAG: DNA-3-methyladenine glycosylase 2 family protein [Rhodospirillaceae bacterium]|nr:DNA-3-methyladenine glycosylase 2 family protein [Rhodospirillaceae bacterium]MDD9918442.1 DNA-3-methyladenine glycosylase 2 family protein [Rhodospirillaceae bacterium]